MDVMKLAEQLQDVMVKDRRELHKIPEFGFELPKTQAYVMKRLKEIGLDPKPCGILSKETADAYQIAGFPKQDRATGVVATVGQGEPCILLRADMDALPMPETNDVEYKSQHEGMMHSCGHDGHTAMLLGAAQIFKDHEDELKGTVKLMFQSGEEWGYGSQLMIDDGLLENPKVDAAFAMHVATDQLPGKIQYTTGITSSSFDSYILDIRGQGGHSSMPHKCIDPNLIAGQIYQALNILPGRETDPAASVSLVVGGLNGGTASNVIPDTANLAFGMRTYDKASRDHLKKRIPEIVDYTTKMWRGEYDLYPFNCPSTYNDEEMMSEVLPYIAEMAGEENIETFPGMPASEDFGHVSEEVPGAYIMLGAGGPDNYPVHNPNMKLDESVFTLGAAIHVNVAMKWLENHQK